MGLQCQREIFTHTVFDNNTLSVLDGQGHIGQGTVFSGPVLPAYVDTKERAWGVTQDLKEERTNSEALIHLAII